MAVTKSKSQDISSPEGNSLAVFLDGNDNILKVKDIYGVMQSLDSLSNAVEEVDVEANSGLTVIRVGDVVTLGTDGAILQRKDEKGVANGYASLDADGKIPVDQLPNSVLTYEGLWDAATNDPTLVDGTGNDGDFYIVSVGGTQDLGSGPITFEVGDWVIYSGTTWQRNPSATETLQTVTDRGNTTTNGITTASTTSDFFELNTTAAHGVTEGQIAWNETDGTVDIGMKRGEAVLQVGMETYYPPVVNKSGEDLIAGTLMMADPTGIAQGNRLRAVKSIADGTYPSNLLLGIYTEDVLKNQEGYCTWFGYVRNVDLTQLQPAGETWAEGDVLYANPAVAGGLTKVEPQSPNIKSTIAVITSINGINLTLLVRPWLNHSLGEQNDVTLTAVADNDILQFDLATSTWINVEGTTTSIAEGLNLYFTQARARASVSGTDGIGYTEATGVFTNTDKGSSQSIIKTIDGDTGTITADSNNDSIQIIGGTNVTTDISGKTLTINSTDQFQGTVTSVAVTESGGLSVTGSPITTAGTINIENTDKGSSQNIFKNIASSGQPTIVAGSNDATFFIEGAGTTSITQDAGTNTITITSNDAHEGTVTSVDITAGSGISSSGGPITSSGSITVTNTDKGSDQNIFKQVDTGTGSTYATSNNDVLVITGASGSGISTDTNVSGHVEINNTDKGSSQNIFKNVAVSGQDTIVADSNDDTLNLSAGDNIVITTDSATDTIVISSPDAGGTVTSIDITAGDGISSAGGPITSSGSITITNTDRGSSQNIFKNFIVDNDDTITADSNNDRIFILGGDGISTLMADVESIEIQNDDRGSSQNIFKNVGSDSGTAVADNNDDLLIIAGGTGVSTAVSGDTLTVTNTDTGSAQNIFKNVAVSGQSTIVADSNNDTLTLAEGSGIVITTDAATDTITISSPDAGGTVTSVDLTAGAGMSVSGGPITTSGSITVTNTDRGSSQAIFKNFAVSGQSTVVADSNNDTLTLAAGTNVSITTNATTDTITINSTDQYVGTVTSVAVAAGTGMSVSGSPITTSGTITVTNNDRGSSQNIFKNIAVSGQSTIVADSNNDTLTFGAGTDIVITTDAATDTLVVNHSDTSALSGTYGSTADGTKIDTITVDARGHVTAITTGATGDITGVTAGDGLSGGGTSGTVTLTNADKGSSQAIFKTVAVSGQTSIVADSNNDTLTFAAGSNISLTTNATTDTLTINATADAPPLYAAGSCNIKNTYGGSGITTTNACYSVALSGKTHDLDGGIYSTILNGKTNRFVHNAASAYSRIRASVIGGGYYNTICSTGNYNVYSTGILSGQGHVIQNAKTSVVAGGNYNCIYSGTYDIGYAFIGGGGSNKIRGHSYGGFIGGGTNNKVFDSWYSLVVGGSSNTVAVYAPHSFIGGGKTNCIGAYAEFSTIVGGCNNIVNRKTNASYDAYGFIGGGRRNSVDNKGQMEGFPAPIATVVGGFGNDASGSGAFIGGGFYSSAPSLNGTTNNVASGLVSVAVGGSRNLAYGMGSVVVGGGAVNAIIGFGQNNESSGSTSFVGAGTGNKTNAAAGAIVAGANGVMCGSYVGGFIGAASSGVSVPNPVGADSCIGAGNAMVIGRQNCIPAYSGIRHSFIGSGSVHYIGNSYSSIVGGCENFVAQACSFIGGGNGNRVNGAQGVIVGGAHNRNDSFNPYNTIVAGAYNYITCKTGQFNFIGGGRNNCIDSPLYDGYANVVVGGQNNQASGRRNSVVGGNNNLIFNMCAFNGYAFIGGGNNNVITGSSSTSAILGGQNNVIADRFQTFIVGSGINADRANTTFVNNLSIMSIPTSPLGLPAGSVWNAGGQLMIV